MVKWAQPYAGQACGPESSCQNPCKKLSMVPHAHTQCSKRRARGVTGFWWPSLAPDSVIKPVSKAGRSRSGSTCL